MSWPVVELDAIRRLRALAVAVPGAVIAETTLDLPFESTWAVASDIERELPRFVPTVRSVRVVRLEASAEVPAELTIEAYFVGLAGARSRFDIVLRPGWCVMRGRFVLGAMAAVADGERTTFAFLGGMRLPGQRVVSPVLTAFGRATVPYVVDRFARRAMTRARQLPAV